MAAIICIGIMFAVWIKILVALFTGKRDVPGMYTSFRAGGTYSTAVPTTYTRGEYSRAPNGMVPSAPRHTGVVHYTPQMPAPLAPPAQEVPTAPVWTPVWTVALSSNSTEHELLAALRVRPDDAASRMVYSDWLEQRGELAKAAYVRGDHLRLVQLTKIATTTSATWRAVTCRQFVACVQMKCPKQWDRLATLGDDERTRRCPGCGRTVRYCASIDEARRVRDSGDLSVVDLAAQALPKPVDDRFPSGTL